VVFTDENVFPLIKLISGHTFYFSLSTYIGFHRIDFDRQRVIGNFIVDFYVKALGLVIEIDGSSHIGKEDYDKQRQNYLESLGL